jgi:hypothetical protein
MTCCITHPMAASPPPSTTARTGDDDKHQHPSLDITNTFSPLFRKARTPALLPEQSLWFSPV